MLDFDIKTSEDLNKLKLFLEKWEKRNFRKEFPGLPKSSHEFDERGKRDCKNVIDFWEKRLKNEN